jgi:hypothetical protein
MGYTHYFYTPKQITDAEWDALLGRVHTLYTTLPAGLLIRGGFGTGEPVFSKDMIWFNGDEASGEDYETLLIEKNVDTTSYAYHSADRNGGLCFNFCKTERKPYDPFVCAVLIALKDSVPKSKISTDGDAKDWADALEFYNSTMGTNHTFLEVLA